MRKILLILGVALILITSNVVIADEIKDSIKEEESEDGILDYGKELKRKEYERYNYSKIEKTFEKGKSITYKSNFEDEPIRVTKLTIPKGFGVLEEDFEENKRYSIKIFNSKENKLLIYDNMHLILESEEFYNQKNKS